MPTREYEVCIPITGYAWVTVEAAESEEDAINQALDSDIKLTDIEEWSTHRHVCEGNVFHGARNDAYAECYDGEDEEHKDSEQEKPDE